MYHYRNATIHDLEAIIQLKNQVKQHNKEIQLDIWQNDYPNKTLLEEDIQNQTGRILETADHKIIAYASLEKTQQEYGNEAFGTTPSLSFSRLMVDNTMHNQGIGTTFIQHMISETRNQNIHQMAITVDSFNENAIHLYKKLGFEKTGTLHFSKAKFILDKYVLTL